MTLKKGGTYQTAPVQSMENINIDAVPNAGRTYFGSNNYNGNNSIVLMAAVDAHRHFIMLMSDVTKG